MRQHRQLAVARDARQADSEGDVGLARRRIAARVIMNQDEASSADRATPAYDMTDADTYFADRTSRNGFYRKQVAMLVNEEGQHPFLRFGSQRRDILFKLGQAAQSPRMSRDGGPL